jgi:hypothetical protein
MTYRVMDINSTEGHGPSKVIYEDKEVKKCWEFIRERLESKYEWQRIMSKNLFVQTTLGELIPLPSDIKSLKSSMSL